MSPACLFHPYWYPQYAQLCCIFLCCILRCWGLLRLAALHVAVLNFAVFHLLCCILLCRLVAANIADAQDPIDEEVYHALQHPVKPTRGQT